MVQYPNFKTITKSQILNHESFILNALWEFLILELRFALDFEV